MRKPCPFFPAATQHFLHIFIIIIRVIKRENLFKSFPMIQENTSKNVLIGLLHLSLLFPTL